MKKEIKPMVEVWGVKKHGLLSRLTFSEKGFEWEHHQDFKTVRFQKEKKLAACFISWDDFHKVMREHVRNRKGRAG